MAQRKSSRRSKRDYAPVDLPQAKAARQFAPVDLPQRDQPPAEAHGDASGYDIDLENRLMQAQTELEDEIGFMQGPVGVQAQSFVGGPFGGENILGTCIGEKEPGVPAVIVFVARKSENDREAGIHCIRKKVRDFHTDVVQTGPICAQAAPPGSGIDADRGFLSTGVRGTLGCLCARDFAVDNRLFLLSNTHVLAPTTDFKTDETIVSTTENENLIARLSYWTDFQDSNNVIDVAMAHTGTDLVRPDRPGFPIDPTPTRAHVGMAVTKFGDRTGQTFGIVKGVNSKVNVRYRGIGVVPFINQLFIEGSNGRFSYEGDSGALVVEQGSHRPVGLHFAGDGGINSYSNPIEVVMRLFGIREIVTTF